VRRSASGPTEDRRKGVTATGWRTSRTAPTPSGSRWKLSSIRAIPSRAAWVTTGGSGVAAAGPTASIT
jgi:hypothetical protein